MEIEANDDLKFFSEQSFFDKSVEETLSNSSESKQLLSIPDLSSKEKNFKTDICFHENNDNNFQIIIDIERNPKKVILFSLCFLNF